LKTFRTENDANRTNLLDNLTALNLDQNNAKKQLNEQINKVNLIFRSFILSGFCFLVILVVPR